MAGIAFTTAGVDALARVLNDIANIPDDVQGRIVDAMADVVEEAQVYTAGTMLQGPYYQGDVAGSVKKSRIKKRKSGPYVDIEFKGMAHGNRLAEIAFINEYGKKSQPARPFIKTANTISDEPSKKAGFAVYDDWLKSKGV
jgi:hypothetical protein